MLSSGRYLGDQAWSNFHVLTAAYLGHSPQQLEAFHAAEAAIPNELQRTWRIHNRRQQSWCTAKPLQPGWHIANRAKAGRACLSLPKNPGRAAKDKYCPVLSSKSLELERSTLRVTHLI
jgi:hypothetical protein